MPMLAERKKKEKWILMPKKPMWSTDADGMKFGQKLMEKMGWSAGKGLGANEQGIQEPLRVSYKNDTKGMGFKLNDDECMTQQNEFNDLLAQLSCNADLPFTKPEETLKTEISSLEEKSKKSKCRVHYQKFTRGKDLSRYSENDLACIFGINKKKTENNICEGNADESKKFEGDKQKDFGVKTIHGGSLTDYFKNKQIVMKQRENKPTMDFSFKFENRDDLFQGADQNFSDDRHILPEVKLKEKKRKKRKCSSPLNDSNGSEAETFVKNSDCSIEFKNDFKRIKDISVENKSEVSSSSKIQKKKFKENFQPVNNINPCEIQSDPFITLENMNGYGNVNIENKKGGGLTGDNTNQIDEKILFKKRKYSIEKLSINAENTNVEENEKKFVDQNTKLEKKEKRKFKSDLSLGEPIKSKETDCNQIFESCGVKFNSATEIDDVKSVKKKKKKQKQEEDNHSVLNVRTSLNSKELKIEDKVESTNIEKEPLKKKKKNKKSKDSKREIFEEKNTINNSAFLSNNDEKKNSLNVIESEANEASSEKKKERKKKKKETTDNLNNESSEEIKASLNAIEPEANEVSRKKNEKKKRKKSNSLNNIEQKITELNSPLQNEMISGHEETESENLSRNKKKKKKSNDLNDERIEENKTGLNEIKPRANDLSGEKTEKKKRINENNEPVEKRKTNLNEIRPEANESSSEKKKKKQKTNDLINVEEKNTEQKSSFKSERISDCEEVELENWSKKKRKNKEKKEDKKTEKSDSLKVEKINELKMNKKSKKEKKLILASASEIAPDGEVKSIEIMEKKEGKNKGEVNEIVEELKHELPKSKSEANIKENASEFETNIIHTHKTTLFNKRKGPKHIFPSNMTNSRALKLFFGAQVDEFKGSNLGDLEGYGKSLRRKTEDIERPSTV